jgi:hypothetical protein
MVPSVAGREHGYCASIRISNGMLTNAGDEARTRRRQAKVQEPMEQICKSDCRKASTLHLSLKNFSYRGLLVP